MARVLCYRSWGMWDFITTIPKRYQIKKNWDELYLLSYSDDFNKHKWRSWLFSDFDEISLDKWLVKKVIKIPYNRLKLLWFCIKNFHKFDKFYMPIKTKWWYLLWKILSKKAEYSFENPRDTSQYKNIIEWEIQNSQLLVNYRDFFTTYLKDEIPIKFDYICIYPSDNEKSRSLSDEKWVTLLNYLLNKYTYKILLIWWKREKWFSNLIKKTFQKEYWKRIIDNIEYNTLKWSLNILRYSVLNISCNWWIMRCGCLLNKNNLTIQIKSANIYKPPEDWIHTINIIQKKCKLFCDWKCRFEWTDKENVCKEIELQEIINWIDKIIENL